MLAYKITVFRMKQILLMMMAVMMLGCESVVKFITPNSPTNRYLGSRIADLKVGMTKAQVLKMMGQTETVPHPEEENMEFLFYRLEKERHYYNSAPAVRAGVASQPLSVLPSNMDTNPSFSDACAVVRITTKSKFPKRVFMTQKFAVNSTGEGRFTQSIP